MGRQPFAGSHWLMCHLMHNEFYGKMLIGLGFLSSLSNIFCVSNENTPGPLLEPHFPAWARGGSCW